jgi:hypothetical protein
MHPFVLTASEQELWFIAGLDYGQSQEEHFQALKELIFQRNGTFLPTNSWFPYEVIELGANTAQVGHEREFAICSLLVIHGVVSGFDTWTELEQKFSNLSAITPNNPVKATPSGRWTLRDKAQRSAPYLQR